MKKFEKYLIIVGLLTGAFACSRSTNTVTVPEMKEEIVEETKKIESGLYAELEIIQGSEKFGKILIRLFPDKTPVTVENFVGLAEGRKEYVDIKTGEKQKGRYYDGLILHRVIPNFMIQGGDPTGTGRGGPGYKFQDEIVSDLLFDKPGLLAMANSGPNTNGSQFFITVAATPRLNGRHTIFGEVIEGQDLIKKISEVQTLNQNKPVTPVVVRKMTIKKER